MNLPLFIAQRLYSDTDGRKKVSRPAIRISVLGVAIGLAVMIISVCVVIGFKHSIRDKVTGFGSHITVADYQSLQTDAPYPICIDDSLIKALNNVDGVTHVQRYALKQGILKTDDDFLGVTFKGVGPDFDTTFIASCMVEGSLPHFSDSASSNKIVVSRIIADKLHLKTGSRIFTYFMGDNDVRTRRYTVSGIYCTNLKHFDESICLTDLYSIVKLNGWESDQASGAELAVADMERLDDIDTRINDMVGHKEDKYGAMYTSMTILNSYPSIFAWLELLDIDVWIILGLMLAVASFTMISGLLIIIIERTSMIGTLKAMGARNSTIQNTFLWFAVFIIGKGMLIGNILGLGLCLLQQLTGVVKLDAETYYVDVVPVEINIPLILLINAFTLIVSVIVLIAPSYLITHIQPAKSMKYE